MLFALVESHAAIDSTDVFARLKEARAIAGIPPPSVVSINQGLADLFEIHAEAAFAGYDTIQDAAGPMLKCTLQTLSSDERHYIEPLGSLLSSYRQALDPARMDAADQIEDASAALIRGPHDPSSIKMLSDAAHIWTSLCHPFLLWNADQPGRELNFDTPIERLRALTANLCENRRYEVAMEVIAATRESFAAVPTTIDQLTEDARLLAKLSSYATVKRLKDAIEEAENAPGALIAALEKDGFGQKSAEPAKTLWNRFVKAAKTTGSASPEPPWRLVHDFAVRLSNKPEAAAAVAALISGLIWYGERAPLSPGSLKELHDNLRFMQSFMGTEPATEIPSVDQPVAKKEAKVAKLFAIIKRRSPPKRRRAPLVGFALLALVALCAAFYLYPDRLRASWTALSSAVPFQLTASTPGVETMPPVGTGQHLALDGVRYCHFQQERLRVIKQLVSGPEDTRAYNLLIVDYNSRCSDFFYKDEDLKLVLAEVSAKKALLEAGAKQIVSTWPGHAAEASSKN